MLKLQFFFQTSKKKVSFHYDYDVLSFKLSIQYHRVIYTWVLHNGLLVIKESFFTPFTSLTVLTVIAILKSYIFFFHFINGCDTCMKRYDDIMFHFLFWSLTSFSPSYFVAYANLKHPWKKPSFAWFIICVSICRMNKRKNKRNKPQKENGRGGCFFFFFNE